MNSEGLIICAYCGKPIVKAYDCICHHKEYLTEENVNDYNISLNPDNIDLVHHRCHNYIHDKLGYSTREVFLVYGAPFSGKKTFVMDNMGKGDLIVNIDDIWACVAGEYNINKPNSLRPIVFKLRDTLIDCVKYRLGRWNNAYIIGGYPFQSDRERLIKALNAREIYIESTMAECIERLKASNELDFEENKRYIEEWFDRFSV